ncbi:hypothetical protein ACM66B_003901 [Microbotryomycetes sp. NB124-2]
MSVSPTTIGVQPDNLQQESSTANSSKDKDVSVTSQANSEPRSTNEPTRQQTVTSSTKHDESMLDRESDEFEARLNPVFDLSRQVESGQLDEVHVMKVGSNGSVDWKTGQPPTTSKIVAVFKRTSGGASAAAPAAAPAAGSAATLGAAHGHAVDTQSRNGHRQGKRRRDRGTTGDAQRRRGSSAASTSTSSTSSSTSSCDEQDGNDRRLVLVGSGQDDYRPEEHVGDGRDGLSDFQDHEFESSKRDELRMKAVGWKSDFKSMIKGKGKATDPANGSGATANGSTSAAVADPAVTAALARQPSQASSHRSDATTTTATAERRHDTATTGPDGSITTHDSLERTQSSSPHSSAYVSVTDRPFRSESPESFRYPARSSTPPPAGVSVDQQRHDATVDPGRDRMPILNAPGQYVTNSRAPPTTIPGSPPRLVPITSLNKPLHAHPSNSSLKPTSSEHSRMGASTSPRRSATSLVPSASRTSNSSSSRLVAPPGAGFAYAGDGGGGGSPLMPQRAMSFQHPPRSPVLTGGAESSYFSAQHANALPHQQQFHPYDEVESSIAAQAEVIRKQRQEKRLEKEKEQQEQQQQPTVGGGGAAVAGGGAPMLRRRTTRAGSGDMKEPGAGVLVGNLIGQDHANYVLMYNMLTGIRIGVSRCEAKPKRQITDADYTARHKFSFDIVGNELTPSVKYDFKFKDYAPWVFRELREYFYLDPSDYLVSLTAKYILSELGSPGKSGSFFYFSRDYRFIIKTIRHSEHKFLRSILKEYHEHIKANPHTLLSRFYGLHRVKLPRGRKIHFVIMNNLFPPHRDIHETYDLKGSAIGRMYPEEKARDNPRAILKDLNFIIRDRFFFLGPEKKALFQEQLRRDVELMQRLGIMDYSLLTGIHNVARGNVDNLRDNMLTVFQPETVKIRRRGTMLQNDADKTALRKAVQRSDPKALGDGPDKLPDRDMSERRLFLFYQDEGGMKATGLDNSEMDMIYYLGIIDILTPYTFVKKLEHFFKGFKHDKHMISAVAPKEYGERFLSFIYSRITGNDPTKGPRMFEHPPAPLGLSAGATGGNSTDHEGKQAPVVDPSKVKQE